MGGAMGGAMGGVWVAVLLLALSGPVQPQAGPLTESLASGLDLLADGDATGAQDGLSALHREYDKSWRHRVGSAAAEPSADDEDAEGDAGGAAKPAEDDAVPEDALPPKRRRYTRKRLRPQAQDDVEADASVAAKRKKPGRDDDEEEHRRRKPGQRRRRPHRPDTEAAQDADAEDEARHIDAATEQQGAAQPSVASPSDLKSLLKQTAGQLSLSELLQNRNLSLSDLLKGNRGALSALTAPHGQAAHANDAAPSAASSTAADAEDEPATERHNGFVPSKPRRLPPTPRPSAAPSPSSRPEPEPEVTTSRPRRLPAVVARVKAEQQAKGHAATQADALDPMNPAMMAMIALEAADTHTSKPRRIPPPAATSTASPSTSSTTSTTTTTTTSRTEAAAPSTTAGTTTSTSAGTTLPPRDFYPLNVDSLEITTPRLMGVSKAAASKPAWLPPADRIIDAQVFSPGSIANKFRTHGFVASGEQALDRPEMTPPTTTTTSTLPPQPATLQNTSDHFRLENETLDLKEGNALDKRKIGSMPSRTEQNTTSSSTQHAQHANELDKADKDKAEKRKPLIPIASTGPRRLPPTLAGTRRLPAALPTRPKTTTEPPAPERPRLPFLVNKRAKDKERERERERDALLPPTRFALPLPEVISVEKMIADARSRGALEQGTTVSQSQASSERTTTTDAPAPSVASTSPSTSTTFASRDEILDLLKSEQSSTRLSRILAERNMTLEDLLQHRERGSSQLHFADFIRSDRNATSKAADEAKPIDLVPKEIAPAERKDSVNILRSFHEVPKYPFAYSSAGEATDDSEEAASTLSLVNVKPAGIVLPADPGERYHHQRSAVPVAAAAPSRAPRVVVPQPQAPPPPPPPPPQPYPIPTFRLPEPPAHASNPYLVIKHVPDAQDAMTVAMTDTVPDRPDAVVLEHVGEIRQVGVSSSVEEAIVVDSVRDNVRHSDRPDRLDRLSLPSGVKSAIIASTVICGLAIVGFLTIFIVFRWRQKRALIRARGAILCEQLQRGSFRGRSLSPVLVNVSKSSQVQPMQHSGPVPYYSKKDLSSRATSNTASNRHYYLWRSLRKTFQEDDMD